MIVVDGVSTHVSVVRLDHGRDLEMLELWMATETIETIAGYIDRTLRPRS